MSEENQSGAWTPAFVCALIPLLGVIVGLCVQSAQFDQKLAADREQFDKKFQKELKDGDDLRRSEIEQRAKEFKIKFYENQMIAYKELCQIVSKIAMTRQLKDEAKDFWRLQELIIGELHVYADQDVLDTTYRFNERLKKLPKDTQSLPVEMQRPASEVSEACRNSLMATFDLNRYGRFGKGLGVLPSKNGN